jgi:hypothetical protein
MKSAPETGIYHHGMEAHMLTDAALRNLQPKDKA